MAASEHEIQAAITTAGTEKQEKFSDSLENENTNEKEESSGKQTNSKSPEDKLDIELILLLVCHFLVILKIRLNGLKYYINMKVTWNSISSSLENKYATESMFFHLEAMLFDCLDACYSLS